MGHRQGKLIQKRHDHAAAEAYAQVPNATVTATTAASNVLVAAMAKRQPERSIEAWVGQGVDIVPQRNLCHAEHGEVTHTLRDAHKQPAAKHHEDRDDRRRHHQYGCQPAS